METRNSSEIIHNLSELIFIFQHLRYLEEGVLDEFTYDLKNIDKELIKPLLFIIEYYNFDYSLLRNENYVLIRIWKKK